MGLLLSLVLLILQSFFSISKHLVEWQLSLLAVFLVVCFGYGVLIVQRRHNQIYLMDFGCYTPPETLRAPSSAFMEYSRLSGKFDEKSLEFQSKILERSGISQRTALPHGMHFLPPRANIEYEREECKNVLYGAIDELLGKIPGGHDWASKNIGIVVSNCSVFSPTPSMTSMIINKYKLRENVKNFTLAGMGCSAGLLALDCAKRVLQAEARRGNTTYALVLSTENLTKSWYHGNDRSMLVTNCLFRMGGSAVILSNKSSDKGNAKYKVLLTARTMLAANDKAYRCVYQEEDNQGIIGVALSKDLMKCAALALEHNMKQIGPKVLPWREIMLYIADRYLNKTNGKGDDDGAKNVGRVPNFKDVFQNVCIHAGGKAVVKAMEDALHLPFRLSEPSHMTLYRFGNLSSSSVWYELAYEEAKGRVIEGNKVWQIGLGSGFKCCSSVLVALRTISSTSHCWDDCIDSMPVPLDECYSTGE